MEKHVFETAIKMGIPPRAEINSPEEAKYYWDMGVRHFCIGTDLFVLYQWMKDNGAGMRKLFESH